MSPTLTSRAAVKADREALIAFYHATGGPQWTNNANWLTDRPLGEWHGIITDGNGRVVELELSENNLTGIFPPELGQLSNLRKLEFYGNNLTGTIPPELGQLSNLRYLGLLYNDLTGTVPPELGRLSNLTELWLSRNRLTGPIPVELGGISNLAYLTLDANELTEELPLTLTMLIKMEFSLWNDNAGLCAPPSMQEWLQGIGYAAGPVCAEE